MNNPEQEQDFNDFNEEQKARKLAENEPVIIEIEEILNVKNKMLKFVEFSILRNKTYFVSSKGHNEFFGAVSLFFDIVSDSSIRSKCNILRCSEIVVACNDGYRINRNYIKEVKEKMIKEGRFNEKSQKL